ncbi:HlyD family secretion protein [Mucilaginibacter sp. BT774]|uniref:HlyD family secretion protein n=1 Tax=Mucilaginibacter sp. BT774 TaxID=3062276 RepID=UPI002674EC3D|nr:HlyD family efflux transporter periplasmic adaptor subunit [Mucilaginibacter sp. BT774]MDO3627474.1 HlyD family efflux transporter periplasmic adaptor subunit [Mucilaginibacter sp. BT774]
MSMPEVYIKQPEEIRHSEEMEDIIAVPPSWMLRWGVTLFIGVLILIIALSTIIKYPDVVDTTLKIESPNAPKPIVTKVQGKLVKILVKENQQVDAGQPLAYIESTANHNEVLKLINQLKYLQKIVLSNKSDNGISLDKTDNSQLGELQASFQSFSQEYLSYRSAVENGFYIKKKAYLQKDLIDLNKQEVQLKAQKSIQEKDLSLAEEEYRMHQKLAKERVETSAELRQEESKYLAKKAPLIQTATSLVAASTNYSAKEKEILELDNQINEEKSKFSQALNSLISQADDWVSKYVLIASQPGKLAYVGILQESQVLNTNQEVFYVNPGNEAFFGEMAIPQNSMGKVKEGQEVLIRLKSYPFEEYGMLKGKLSHIAEVPYKDSVFLSKVDFKIRNASDMKRPIHLKQGMTADAEIITQDATLLERIGRNIVKLIDSR